MLIGEKVILRPLKRSDMSKTITWRNDIDVIKQAQLIRFPKSEEMEKEWWDNVLIDKSNRNVYFAVEEKSSSNFIGIIQLNQIDWISGTAVWGFIIGNKEDRGKGYSTEAPRLLFDYAFNILNLRKIFGYPVEYNQATLKMHQKIGNFKQEGKLVKHYYINNEYHDVLILSLFREDFIK
ncbi:MAG: hypothetical protein A2W98_01215 [Bacteroidetes bacterium GWF2_33_38]|nr:MAG: hypothetical protein A2W98_01215 [Bacteroidetes bacterium GWF2_33_38]OFY73581.1 MAG: hypothetical protein A2265_02475 [Bacteroidetes bacterium RIFOXYA12_FULL_33_9]HBX50586.1 hypothetical protein [Bacteroidales bacterium]